MPLHCQSLIAVCATQLLLECLESLTGCHRQAEVPFPSGSLGLRRSELPSILLVPCQESCRKISASLSCTASHDTMMITFQICCSAGVLKFWP